jgi:murein L,D-transpeptidase YcbB/YkuD
MRGACLIAVLLGAAQAFGLGAGIAFAQDAQVPPEAPMDASQPASAATPAVVPAEAPPLAAAAEAPAETDPVVAIIRTKLGDALTGKGADEEDLAALKAFYAARAGGPLWITDMGFTAKGQRALSEIEKADDWGLDTKSFELPSAAELPANQEAQALAEIKLDLAILKYARYARGGRLTPSKVSELYDQVPHLRDPKAVLAEIEAADAPDAYLRSLHPRHEQFQRLHQALVAARGGEGDDAKPAASAKDIRRLIINMERWRWMPEDLGSLYVWNNSPEYKLYVVKDGKTIFADKTLVGTIGYATPVFTADMKTIVFNPDWNAPETVVTENLWPPLKNRSYSILRIHKLQVSYNGTPIDPTRVDWNRVNILNYTFTQKAGPDNVLGKVKFLFPNRHTVYMHDTTAGRRKYFKQPTRMIGHECVRMERPDKFAEVLLAEDKGWDAGKIKGLWDTSVNSPVSIAKEIPVHMVYFTAVVDDAGKVDTFADIYGLDRKLALALFGDATGFPQPPPESKQPQYEASDARPSVDRRAGVGDFANAMQGFLGD